VIVLVFPRVASCDGQDAEQSAVWDMGCGMLFGAKADTNKMRNEDEVGKRAVLSFHAETRTKISVY
jgi:hypothetical protein